MWQPDEFPLTHPVQVHRSLRQDEEELATSLRQPPRVAAPVSPAPAPATTPTQGGAQRFLSAWLTARSSRK